MRRRLCLFVLFADSEAVKAFRIHPKRQPVIERIGPAGKKQGMRGIVVPVEE